MDGVIRDLQGDPVSNGVGGYYDHVHEVRNAYEGLLKAQRSLLGSLSNPNLTSEARAILESNLNLANDYTATIENIFSQYGGVL